MGKPIGLVASRSPSAPVAARRFRAVGGSVGVGSGVPETPKIGWKQGSAGCATLPQVGGEVSALRSARVAVSGIGLREKTTESRGRRRADIIL